MILKKRLMEIPHFWHSGCSNLSSRKMESPGAGDGVALPMSLSQWDAAVRDWRRGTDSWGLSPHPERVCRADEGPSPGTDGIKRFYLFDYSSWQIEICKGFRTWCRPPFSCTLQLGRPARHLVSVRRLCCVTLLIAGEHLLAFARLEGRPRGTKWPHSVYIFSTALLTYLLTSGKNLQVNLSGSFSKE